MLLDSHDKIGWKMLILGSDGIWDSVTIYELVKLLQIFLSETNELLNQNVNVVKLNITLFMIRLQNICTKKENLYDKLSGRFYGDNCTSMIIINKNNYNI